MIKWPAHVIEELARRRAIVVLGAGSSFHATPLPGSSLPPDWKTFLTSAMGNVPAKSKAAAKRLVNAGEYLSACEIIKTSAGGDWPNIVNVAFGNNKLEHGLLHESIYSLDLPLVMTTNFDRIYQTAATKLSAGTVKVKSYSDLDLALVARGDAQSRVILKVHGTIDDVGSMVFTRSDYVSLRNKYPLFQYVIRSLAVTNTLIFVGCGLRDPDMMLLLEDVASISKGFGRHYCVIDSKQDTDLEAVYKDCYGLVSLRYKFDDAHGELPLSLKELGDQVGERRTELAAAGLW